MKVPKKACRDSCRWTIKQRNHNTPRLFQKLQQGHADLFSLVKAQEVGIGCCCVSLDLLRSSGFRPVKSGLEDVSTFHPEKHADLKGALQPNKNSDCLIGKER